jgi:hypothetical protein
MTGNPGGPMTMANSAHASPMLVASDNQRNLGRIE